VYVDGADYYDLIHRARGRQPDLEAELVALEARRRSPGARSLLDVACGTGIHLPKFGSSFSVAGVDRSPSMLDAASRRCPHAELAQADMRSFRLGKRFDVVVSLDSGVGYLDSNDDLLAAIRAMANHLEPSGVLLIEGWYEAEFWVSSMTVDAGAEEDMAVARFTRSRRDGDTTELDIRYEVATASGHRSIEELHKLRLSDPDEFSSAFASAGLTFERLPHMLRPGRSVYVGGHRS
jgi:SAM-dependent methyltransferase